MYTRYSCARSSKMSNRRLVRAVAAGFLSASGVMLFLRYRLAYWFVSPRSTSVYNLYSPPQQVPAAASSLKFPDGLSILVIGMCSFVAVSLVLQIYHSQSDDDDRFSRWTSAAIIVGLTSILPSLLILGWSLASYLNGTNDGSATTPPKFSAIY